MKNALKGPLYQMTNTDAGSGNFITDLSKTELTLKSSEIFCALQQETLLLTDGAACS